MVATVAGIAAVGHLALGLSPGAAVLVGAVLAPTDPVLASDVQVEHAGDHEEVRFALTGEAGLNDGMAFPFVMLGLGLDDFFALALIALSHRLALAIHSYGFLAVFAAGLALRRIERQDSGQPAPAQIDEAADGRTDAATDDERAPAAMAQAVLAFNQQLERVGEVAIVLVIGSRLCRGGHCRSGSSRCCCWRSARRATFLTLPGTKTTIEQRLLVAWFGVRGIGSIY